MRRLFRGLLVLLLAVLVVVLTGGAYAWWRLRASLPSLDGALRLPGLGTEVRVVRDRYGIPSFAASTRVDQARVMGFLHAQDRFFQMDLQRRNAAGELAALVGARALPLDRTMRVHRFRARAAEALTLTTPEYRAVLQAYAEGVNAGLASLAAAPWEYTVLRRTPAPWRAEDTLLTVAVMTQTLQGRQAGFEAGNGVLHDTLPPALFEFVTTRGSAWDAPVIGALTARPSIPGPDVVDLRRLPKAAARRPAVPPQPVPGDAVDALIAAFTPPDDPAFSAGSNNWAVDGAHSSSGAALVANDMHLQIGVPSIWYRASYSVGADPGRPARRVTGVTLPGIPLMAVGSNERVAWGFTNSEGDWSDLVIVEPDPRDATRYLAPDGPEPYAVYRETLDASDGPGEVLEVRTTRWGPIVRKDSRGRELAQHWVVHDPKVLAVDPGLVETSASLPEALANAAGLGIPHQNFVAGDADGRIGWTIIGSVPRRRGLDGRLPASWADGSRGWDGYLGAAEQPRLEEPDTGRIWTANAMVVDGARLAAVGYGDYADGIRARLIRDRLLALPRATPADMLSVQLEDGALFFERWRRLFLDTLTASRVQPDPRRAEFRRLLESTWTGRASVDSVAYRLVRTARLALAQRVMRSLTGPALAADASADIWRGGRGEGPVWPMIEARPAHLLDPAFATWDDAILWAIDDTIRTLTEDGTPLAARTWGEANRAAIRHPLAILPLLGRFLSMPAAPQAGDAYTPRAHVPTAGPSERMAVSPGHEAEGILHIPVGQSAHPLSAYFRSQHEAWMKGEPLPFLPGAAEHTVTLTP